MLMSVIPIMVVVITTAIILLEVTAVSVDKDTDSRVIIALVKVSE